MKKRKSTVKLRVRIISLIMGLSLVFMGIIGAGVVSLAEGDGDGHTHSYTYAPLDSDDAEYQTHHMATPTCSDEKDCDLENNNPIKLPHEYVNGACVCNVNHSHSYPDKDTASPSGKCSICGLSHSTHTYTDKDLDSPSGKCSDCGVAHSTHTYTDKDLDSPSGKCSDCGLPHSNHEFSGGKCSVCGVKESSKPDPDPADPTLSNPSLTAASPITSDTELEFKVTTSNFESEMNITAVFTSGSNNITVTQACSTNGVQTIKIPVKKADVQNGSYTLSVLRIGESGQNYVESSTSKPTFTVAFSDTPAGHTHSYSKTYFSDNEYHWFPNTCYDVCKETLEKDKARHTFDSWYTIKEPTITEKGQEIRECRYCGRTEVRDIDPLEHTHTINTAWSTNGVYHWHEASCKLAEHREGMGAHSFADWLLTIRPTETTTGERVRYCKTCSYPQTEVIPALGKEEHEHTYSTTWSSNGTYHWHQDTCNHGTTKDMSLHAYGAWNITVYPTATTAGSREQLCQVCGYRKTESIPATGGETPSTDSPTIIINNIINAPSGSYVSATYSTNSPFLGADIFETLRGTDKVLTMSNPGGVTWIFRGSTITNPSKDINLNVSTGRLSSLVGPISQLITSLVGDKNTMVLMFPSNGTLPGPATVRIPVDSSMQSYLGATGIASYYVNDTTGSLDLVAQNLSVSSDGYVEFAITHNSAYILTNGLVDTAQADTPTPAPTPGNNSTPGGRPSGGNYFVSPKTGVSNGINMWIIMVTCGFILIMISFALIDKATEPVSSGPDRQSIHGHNKHKNLANNIPEETAAREYLEEFFT